MRIALVLLVVLAPPGRPGIARLQRAVLGAVQTAADARTHLDLLANALDQAPAARPELPERARMLTGRLVDDLWSSRSETPPAAARSFVTGVSQFQRVLEKLRDLLGSDLPALDAEAESEGGAWGRPSCPSKAAFRAGLLAGPRIFRRVFSTH